MDKLKFELLTLDEKAEIVWEHGKYVDSVIYYNCKINLHSVSTDFVEVFYNPQSNEIERISIADELDLKKYINNITIS